MLNKTSTLLLTSLLLSSSLSQAGPLSDAYNGVRAIYNHNVSPSIITKMPMTVEEKNTYWIAESTSAFQKKIDDLGLILARLEGFFASKIHPEDAKWERTIAHAVLSWSIERHNRISYAKEVFEGFSGAPPQISKQLQNPPPVMGTYSKFRELVNETRSNVETIQKQIGTLPTAQSLQAKIEATKKASQAEETKKQKLKADVVDLDKNIEKNQEVLNSRKKSLVEIKPSQVDPTSGQKSLSPDQQSQHAAIASTIEKEEKAQATLLSQKNNVETQIKETEITMQQLTKDTLALEKQIGQLPKDKQVLENKQRTAQIAHLSAQDQADQYALLKYLTVLNVWAALPTRLTNFHKWEDKLHPINPLESNFLHSQINSWGEKNKIHVLKVLGNQRIAFKESIEDFCQKYNKDLKKELCASEDYRSRSYLVDATVGLQLFVDLKGIRAFWEKKEKEKENQNYQFKDVSLSTEDWLKSMESKRPDTLLEKSLNKWRSKVTIKDDSFVCRMGLNAALFNSDYLEKDRPPILSYERLMSEYQPQALKAYLNLKQMKKPFIWNFCVMQLKANFFDTLKDEKVDVKKAKNRILPIYDFVKNKLEKPKTQVSNEDREKANCRAFFKYASYMNMAYALIYDGEGKKLSIYDDTKNLKLLRADQIMAAKAYKWAQKLLSENGKDFVEKHALKAYIFAPRKDEKKLETATTSSSVQKDETGTKSPRRTSASLRNEKEQEITP